MTWKISFKKRPSTDVAIGGVFPTFNTIKNRRKMPGIFSKRENGIGFTGTREGMTEKQMFTTRNILEKLLTRDPLQNIFIHGDCVGSDNQANSLVKKFYSKVVVFPPSNSSLRAYCKADKTFDNLPYLERNREIVNHCRYLVATPSTDKPQTKGGTWYTVNYALSKGKVVYIVYPDGHLESRDTPFA